MDENKEFTLLHQRIAELNAAVGELNFECEKLNILNSNLELQLTEVNGELSRNIILLQHTQESRDRFENELEKMKSKLIKSNDLGNIIENAQDYANSILIATKLGLSSDNTIDDKIYVNQINDLLGKLNNELEKASDDLEIQ